ncbi:MAG: hypothetical protein ABFD69_03600 [Candidatus Sumerlaeia bacterium]
MNNFPKHISSHKYIAFFIDDGCVIIKYGLSNNQILIVPYITADTNGMPNTYSSFSDELIDKLFSNARVYSDFNSTNNYPIVNIEFFKSVAPEEISNIFQSFNDSHMNLYFHIDTPDYFHELLKEVAKYRPFLPHSKTQRPSFSFHAIVKDAYSLRFLQLDNYAFNTPELYLYIDLDHASSYIYNIDLNKIYGYTTPISCKHFDPDNILHIANALSHNKAIHYYQPCELIDWHNILSSEIIDIINRQYGELKNLDLDKNIEPHNINEMFYAKVSFLRDIKRKYYINKKIFDSSSSLKCTNCALKHICIGAVTPWAIEASLNNRDDLNCVLEKMTCEFNQFMINKYIRRMFMQCREMAAYEGFVYTLNLVNGQVVFKTKDKTIK